MIKISKICIQQNFICTKLKKSTKLFYKIRENSSIYIYTVEIISREPLDRLKFDWGTRESHENVLSLLMRF